MERYIAVSDDGEKIGLFHIFDLLEQQEMTAEDAGNLVWAQRRLNDNLPVPYYPTGVNTEAWFSDYGGRVFKDELECLADLIDRYLEAFGYSARKLTKPPDKKIIHMDRFQTIFAI